MFWASQAISELESGKAFLLTAPSGNSMLPLVCKGDKVLLEPISPDVKDIVLVRVGGNTYLHKIVAKKVTQTGLAPKVRYQIGNNHGRINGWASRSSIYGVATEINGVKVRSKK